MKRRFRRLLEAVDILDVVMSLPDTVRRLGYVVSLLVIVLSTGLAWVSELPLWQVPIVLVIASGACAFSLVLVGTAWDSWRDHIQAKGVKASKIEVEPMAPPDESDYIAFMPAMHDGVPVTVVHILKHFKVTNHADLDTRIQEARVTLLDRREPNGVEIIPPLRPPAIRLVGALTQDERPFLPARDAITVEVDAKSHYPAWVRKYNREQFAIRLAIEAAGELPATTCLHLSIPTEEASLSWLDLRQDFLTLEQSLGGAWVEVQKGSELDWWRLRTPATAKPSDVRHLRSVLAVAENKLAREHGLEKDFLSGQRWFKEVAEHSGELKLARLPFVKKGETEELVLSRKVLESIVSLSAAFCLHLASN